MGRPCISAITLLRIENDRQIKPPWPDTSPAKASNMGAKNDLRKSCDHVGVLCLKYFNHFNHVNQVQINITVKGKSSRIVSFVPVISANPLCSTTSSLQPSECSKVKDIREQIVSLVTDPPTQVRNVPNILRLLQQAHRYVLTVPSGCMSQQEEHRSLWIHFTAHADNVFFQDLIRRPQPKMLEVDSSTQLQREYEHEAEWHRAELRRCANPPANRLRRVRNKWRYSLHRKKLANKLREMEHQIDILSEIVMR